MKKILISVLLLSSFSSAELITNVSYLDKKNRCINNNYYSKNGRFYYQYTKDVNTFRSTTSKDYSNSIISSYKYDTETQECRPMAWRILGMSIEDFHFLNALIGLLFGFFMLVAVTYLFMVVGGKK